MLNMVDLSPTVGIATSYKGNASVASPAGWRERSHRLTWIHLNRPRAARQEYFPGVAKKPESIEWAVAIDIDVFCTCGGYIQSGFGHSFLSPREAAMSTHVLFRMIAVSLVSLLCIANSSVVRAQTWKTVKPELGGFSFQMPVVPKAVDRGSIGDKSEVGTISYGMEISGGAIMVFSKPAPSKGGDKTLSQHLDSSRDQVLSKGSRKLVDEKDITLDGYSGRQLNIEQPGGFSSQVRIFILDDREVQLTALWRGKDMPPDMMRFMKSLKLPKKKTS
jgi:hypothetical protein